MMLLCGLRMASDLAFYAAFAGYAAACFGGQLTLWHILLPSVCFGLASHFEGRQPMQTLCGLASLLELLLPGTLAEKAVCLPMAAYVIWSAGRGDFALSWNQQVDGFQWFWKIYPAFALVLGVAWDHDAILYGSLPLAVIALMLRVFLMQTLRHDPAVYTSPKYLAVTVGLLAAVCALAFLLSRDGVTHGVASAAGAVYFGGLMPLLLNLLRVLGGILLWLFLVSFRLILSVLLFLGGKQRENQEILSDMASRMQEMADAAPINGSLIGGVVLSVLAVIFLVAVLLKFLRRPKIKAKAVGAEVQKRASTVTSRRHWPGFFLSPNERVRREYRTYLDYCGRHSVDVQPCDTSLDIAGRAAGMDYAAEAELRQLYLKARYAGSATAQDAARAGELVKTICKQ